MAQTPPPSQAYPSVPGSQAYPPGDSEWGKAYPPQPANGAGSAPSGHMPMAAAYPPMSGGTAAGQPPPGPAAGYPPMTSEPAIKGQQQTPTAGNPAGAYAYPDKLEGHVSPTGYPVHSAGAPPPPVMPGAQPVAAGSAAQHDHDQGCRCSTGWVLFGVGWVFPICWLVAVFLPLCMRNRHNKRAAIASGVLLTVYIVLIIVLAVTAPSWSYRSNRYYTHNYSTTG